MESDMEGLGDIEAQLKNEETTKLKLITPVILNKWDADKIIMEYYFTDGRITVDEYNVAHRGKPKKADYLLLHKNNIPLAIIEAKGADHSADEGYKQTKDYAALLDVPFAYATNGDDLIEADMISGLNKTMKMKDFPTAEMLWERFEKEKQFNADVEKVYEYPYYVTPTGKKPRYYQRIAINRTVEAIAKGQNRILLVMATGTGKTFTAFQIIHRFWKTGLKKKILFLVDRNILVDQTMRKDFQPFENAMIKIDNDKLDTSHEIYLGLYQQLKSENHDYYKKYPRDFFDLIVVDECHRGSADLYSNWHEILGWFDGATQIGMTATPKDDAEPNKNNLIYFGNPIYTYSLKQGIEDGYLAPYKVLVVDLDIDLKGYLPGPGMVDVNGDPVKIKLYTQKDFDRNIVVLERRELVAKRISDFMKVNDGRYDKTIIFCEDIPHCHEMVRLLENENADLVKEDPRYVMQITGDNEIGKAQLDNFIDPGSKYPVIAVTSRLMSTGVDAETCKNIVLDRSIGSMTEFKQIIGRGTRVKEDYEVDGQPETKMYFNILDFRSNYRLFNDPGFDGEPVDVTTVPPDAAFPKPPVRPKTPVDPPIPPENRRVARVNGVDVNIINESVEYLDKDGNLVKTNITNCIRNNVLTQYPTEEDLRKAWLLNKDKEHMAYELLLEMDNWQDSYAIRYGYRVDDYDIICNIAYDIEPPTSKERRINNPEMFRYVNGLDKAKKEIAEMLLSAYRDKHYSALKDLNIFNLPQFAEKGWTKLSAIKVFGNKAKYFAFLEELENKLYEGEIK